MGQAKSKGRHCPATNRTITSVECGENRANLHPCPADCHYNPWAPQHYDQALAIESAVYQQLRQRLNREQGRDVVSALTNDQPLHSQAKFNAIYFHDRDSQGLTYLQRWEREKWKGLNNDQQVFLKALANQRICLLEILEVMNGEETRVRDRLDLSRPPFIIHDKSLTSVAGRFMCILAFCVEMPHYSRLVGATPTLPMLGTLEPEEVIHAIAAHQGGPSEQTALRDWLSAQFALVTESIAAIHEAVETAYFSRASYTKTWYHLTGSPMDFVAAMKECPDAISQPTHDELKEGMEYEWAWKGPNDNPDSGTIPVLGRVLFGGKHIRLEAGGDKRAKELRHAFEAFAGKWIAFERQRVDDLGAQLRARKGHSSNPALVPPSLMPHMPIIETVLSMVSPEAIQSAGSVEKLTEKQNENWCDRALPVLDGKTPRQAASDPKLRPILITLVKHSICRNDSQGLNKGRFLDEGRTARELGLTEIDFPASPKLLALQDKELTDQDDDNFDDDSFPDGWAGPITPD